MAGLIKTTTETLRPRAAEKRQKLEVNIDPSTGTVVGDVRRLRESLEHTLRNAIAYTENRGKVRLSASGDEQAVTITIVDNGAGPQPGRPGTGLVGLKERAEGVGARLRTATVAPHGFELSATASREPRSADPDSHERVEA